MLVTLQKKVKNVCVCFFKRVLVIPLGHLLFSFFCSYFCLPGMEINCPFQLLGAIIIFVCNKNLLCICAFLCSYTFVWFNRIYSFGQLHLLHCTFILCNCIFVITLSYAICTILCYHAFRCNCTTLCNLQLFLLYIHFFFLELHLLILCNSLLPLVQEKINKIPNGLLKKS